MSKILSLEIAKCDNCPYCQWDNWHSHECKYPFIAESFEIKNIKNVSPKCPLPDYISIEQAKKPLTTPKIKL